MPQTEAAETHGASVQTTDREKDTTGPSENKAVASPPSDHAIAEQDRNRRKPLSFNGSFMSIVMEDHYSTDDRPWHSCDFRHLRKAGG